MSHECLVVPATGCAWAGFRSYVQPVERVTINPDGPRFPTVSHRADMLSVAHPHRSFCGSNSYRKRFQSCPYPVTWKHDARTKFSRSGNARQETSLSEKGHLPASMPRYIRCSPGIRHDGPPYGACSIACELRLQLPHHKRCHQHTLLEHRLRPIPLPQSQALGSS